MSQVSYNEVILPYSYTTQFHQEVKYDESDTDWYVTKYDIAVESIIHVDYLSELAPDLVGVSQGTTLNAADIMRVIRQRLMVPRKKLSVKFNGHELIPGTLTGGDFPQRGSMDMQNGPKPQSCNLSQLTNTSFLLTYRIIAHYWENNTFDGDGVISNRKGDAVLSNRWSETIQLDNCKYTNRVREGKYIIRSSNGNLVDHFRETMAILSVPEGCVRKSARYTVSPDGLSLAYRIEDQEVYHLPPAPAFEASGFYIESSPSAGGAKRFGEVYLKLKGPWDVDQRDLMNTAMSVASLKLRLNNDRLGVDPTNGQIGIGLLQFSMMKADMYENVVEIHLKSMLRQLRRVVNRIGLRTSTAMVVSPHSRSNTGEKMEYEPLGTLGLALQAAAYYDPSILNHHINPNTDNMNIGLQPGRSPPA